MVFPAALISGVQSSAYLSSAVRATNSATYSLSPSSLSVYVAEEDTVSPSNVQRTNLYPSFATAFKVIAPSAVTPPATLFAVTVPPSAGDDVTVIVREGIGAVSPGITSNSASLNHPSEASVNLKRTYLAV